MSENNNPDLAITEAEILPAEPYDFEFIVNTLGLIPICGGEAAINLGAITDLEADETGQVIISLHGGESYTLNHTEMAELEQTLRQRIEDNKIKAKEAMKDNIKMQAEAMAELNSGIQPGAIIGAPVKRGRFH